MKRISKYMFVGAVVILLLLLCGCKSELQPSDSPFLDLSAGEVAKIAVTNSDSGHIEEITDAEEITKAVELFKNAVIEKKEAANGAWGAGPVITFYDSDNNELLWEHIVFGVGSVTIKENGVYTEYICKDNEYFKEFKDKYDIAVYED